MLSQHELRQFQLVNCFFLTPVICVFGVFANVINVLIFYRRGLDNTVNISLFGIAISDLCSLLTTQFISICLNPLVEESDIPMVSQEVQYLTGGWPHVCFSRITCCITVYVTAERCACITAPLKVKRIFTPGRTKVVIFVIYASMFLSLVPEYATAYIGWGFYPPKNKTLLRLLFTSNRYQFEGLVFILNATLGLLSFAAVTLCTAILVWKLKITAKWREHSTYGVEQFQNFCLRDKKTMNMIVLIAGILVICYIPGTTFLLVTFFEPEFNLSGTYVNYFIVAWMLGLLLEAINSSVNIFLYYKMSTRYRQAFWGLFSRFRRRRSSKSNSDRENGKSYINIGQANYVERSDSDVMYELSTEFYDFETASQNNSPHVVNHN